MSTQLDAARVFFAGAREVKPDKQGRVAIAADLREYAGLDREVMVAGVFTRIEIWDAERWRERKGGGQSVLSAAASPARLRDLTSMRTRGARSNTSCNRRRARPDLLRAPRSAR